MTRPKDEAIDVESRRLLRLVADARQRACTAASPCCYALEALATAVELLAGQNATLRARVAALEAGLHATEAALMPFRPLGPGRAETPLPDPAVDAVLDGIRDAAYLAANAVTVLPAAPRPDGTPAVPPHPGGGFGE